MKLTIELPDEDLADYIMLTLIRQKKNSSNASQVNFNAKNSTFLKVEDGTDESGETLTKFIIDQKDRNFDLEWLDGRWGLHMNNGRA